MSKVTKSVLKNIVKECLVEILQEGISSDMLIKESRSSRKMSGLAKASKRIRPGDAMHPGLDNVRFTKKVDEAASGLTDDPIMSSIFKDTAQTTLQNQFNAEQGRGSMPAHQGDTASQAVATNEINDLFEGADKWAALAFSDPVNKSK